MVIGSKIKLIAPMFGHEVGEICTITSIDASQEMFSYSYDNGNCDGMMSISLFDKYFAECECEEEELITFDEYIEEIMKNSEIESYTIYGKCMVVHCKLPNGYVIVEHCDCVIPDEYDAEVAYNICMERVENKVRELEMYNVHKCLYEERMMAEDEAECDGCGECEFCPCCE